MIRTKDLFLFVVTLLFLGLAITATVWWQGIHQTPATTTPTFSSGQAVVTASVVPTTPINRAALIATFKEKIAADTSSIVPEPSVPGTTVAAPAASDQQTAVAKVDRCTAPDDTLPYVARWPLTDNTLTVAEGARLVQHTEMTTVASSSASSSPQVTVTTLLQLPLQPVTSATPHCVPSDIVGVSTSGYLLYNTDLRPYRTATADTLIGYARDGYPIYGPYTGTVDQCGGYQSPTGYRYTLSPDRNYMIGCFVAPPQQFHL